MITQSTSSYPCRVDQLNLRVIETLRRRFPRCPIGYSGHETGLAPTVAAIAVGARFVERHVTLDRAMWGSDQAASVELVGLMRLVESIRDVERALGNGEKIVYDEESAAKTKLRRIDGNRSEQYRCLATTAADSSGRTGFLPGVGSSGRARSVQ
ncbi:MAG: N-acetylneuraminate synthase family protein [Deltaproteobacteria bacterium]|nr:N-acetylneuraminate synthase family protein [Deltaproteobacteria bacterium]